MANCIACTSASICNQCGGGKFLKSDKTGCIDNCSDDANSKFFILKYFIIY